jgi:phage shock protein PspC (stress-responsive transcriptional regulator)
MFEMFVLAVIVYIIAAIMYKSGKSEGSRKGYNVGIRRRRR